MSNGYYDVYRKRLNRYGLDFQSRIQGERERDFENYLLKTIYRVDFEYDGAVHYGSLEHSKQDYSETQAYLLTPVKLLLPNGTIIITRNNKGEQTTWMIWWMEKITASGYNRYIVLKMTHYLDIRTKNGNISQWGYFYGPGTAKISDAVKSSTGKSLYTENNNLYTFITPYQADIQKECYFTVTYEDTTTAYVITDLDVSSTPGVAYITVDPVPVRDETPPPTQQEGESSDDYFWLNGGH